MSRPRFAFRWGRVAGSGKIRILAILEMGWQPGQPLRGFDRAGRKQRRGGGGANGGGAKGTA